MKEGEGSEGGREGSEGERREREREREGERERGGSNAGVIMTISAQL